MNSNSKLREAVESLLDLLDDFAITEEIVLIAHEKQLYRETLHTDKTLEVLRKAKAALAAPLRNCDVFLAESEIRSAFIDWYNKAFALKGTFYEVDYGDLKHDVDGVLHDYIRWLLSPVEPKTEGETNGSK